MNSIYPDRKVSTLTPWPMSRLSNMRPAYWQSHGAEERRSGLVHSVLPSLAAQSSSAAWTFSEILGAETLPVWWRTSLHMDIWWSIYVVQAEALRGPGLVFSTPEVLIHQRWITVRLVEVCAVASGDLLHLWLLRCSLFCWLGCSKLQRFPPGG